MVLTIDETSDVPIYQQIRNAIVQAVALGELSPGMRLPSVRSLASDLGVNLHTVNKAYAVLRDEGYVRMRGRSGAFIAESERAQAPEALEAEEVRLSAALEGLAVDYRARGGLAARFVELAAEAAARAFVGDEAADKGSQEV